MPIFGSKIGIALGSSGSFELPTTESQQAISFLYTAPTSSNPFITSSIASIEANIVSADQTGSAGELLFRIASPEDNTSKGLPILKLSSTGSDNQSRVGIGMAENQALEGLLDLRSPTGSSPVSIVLRTNEDGVIQVGEETGRITFAIETSSFLGTGFIASGSTAAIYSRVEGSDAQGAFGSLIFEVNDSSDVTEPVEAIKMGYGADPTFSGVGVAMSASMVMTSTNPVLRIKNSSTNYQIARLGWHSPTDQNDGQLLLFNQGTESVKLNGDEDPADASFIRYGNLALGVTSSTERLTVEGNISASGNITTNTIETISITLSDDSTTNVDTFATSTYNGAIYDYVLKDNTVGARTGQFMVAHDNGSVTFTDTSTKHLTDSTIPEITADISGADVRVRITNGNGYTFKSFVKKL